MTGRHPFEVLEALEALLRRWGWQSTEPLYALGLPRGGAIKLADGRLRVAVHTCSCQHLFDVLHLPPDVAAEAASLWEQLSGRHPGRTPPHALGTAEATQEGRGA